MQKTNCKASDKKKIYNRIQTIKRAADRVEKFNSGDVVVITNNTTNSNKIGEQAIVVRQGGNGYAWIKLSDGREICWKKSWMEKI